MQDTRKYLCVQVEEENTDDVWLAIKGLIGVVSVSLIEMDE